MTGWNAFTSDNDYSLNTILTILKYQNRIWVHYRSSSKTSRKRKLPRCRISSRRKFPQLLKNDEFLHNILMSSDRIDNRRAHVSVSRQYVAFWHLLGVHHQTFGLNVWKRWESPDHAENRKISPMNTLFLQQCMGRTQWARWAGCDLNLLARAQVLREMTERWWWYLSQGRITLDENSHSWVIAS